MIKKIEGLDEAIEKVDRAIGKNIGTFEIDRLTELGIWDVIEAATAYAELQKSDMAIVPVEPTEEMLKAGWGGYCPHAKIKDGLIYMWKAMLGAVE